MRVFSRLLQAKATTGIVGLPVHHSARPELLSLYSRITHSLQRFPESSAYRQGTLSLFNKRIAFIEKTEDLKKIEDEFHLGQMEELIEQAKEELKLISMMEANKPWEPLQEEPLPGQWQYK